MANDNGLREIAELNHVSYEGVEAKPSKKTIVKAKDLILEFSKNDKGFISPSTSCDAFGCVVFEWWNGEKKLTVYVSEDETSYIKMIGAWVGDDQLVGIGSVGGGIGPLVDWLNDR